MNLEFISALRAAGVSLSLQGNTVGFSGPRGALSPELMGVLRSNKDAIREFLRRLPADGKASRSAPAITKTPREGELPLSFAQQRLWFSDMTTA
jgi:hypothetical protein